MYTPYGFPAGYGMQSQPFSPYMPGQNMYQNTITQAQQPAQPASQPVVMQVATVKQVEQAQVPAGGKALVLVGNEPVIAMRIADNMGITTTDYYHIEKFDPDAATPAATADYVTHEELQKAIAVLMQKMQQTAPATNEKEAAKK